MSLLDVPDASWVQANRFGEAFHRQTLLDAESSDGQTKGGEHLAQIGRRLPIRRALPQLRPISAPGVNRCRSMAGALSCALVTGHTM